MAQAAVAAEVHQTLDIHRNFTTKITFDGHFTDFGAQRIKIRFAEVTHTGAFGDTALFTQTLRLRAAHTEDVGQRDNSVLVVGYVDPGYTSH